MGRHRQFGSDAERKRAWREARRNITSQAKEANNVPPEGTKKIASPQGVTKLLETSKVVVPAPVTPNGNLPASEKRRLYLRTRLKALEDEYGAWQRVMATQEAQDATTRINQEREPLFYELWALEKNLPKEEQWWMPVRVKNA